MFENIAAIDIGSTSIKAISIKVGFRDFQIRNFLIEDIDLLKEDRKEAVSEALGRILQDDTIAGSRLISTFPTEDIIIRNLKFPFTDLRKIAETIPYEAEDNIPFPLDSVIFDFQSLGTVDKEKAKVMLTAVRKEQLSAFLEPFIEKEVHLTQLGFQANSLYECYKYFTTIEDENVIQLHIGSKKTILNIICNHQLLYTRSIPWGTEEIRQLLSEELNKDANETETILQTMHLDILSVENNAGNDTHEKYKITKPKLKKIIKFSQDHTEKLLEQILITIKSFHSENEEISYSRILISGGGAEISGIASLISKEMEIPVLAHPFHDSQKDNNSYLRFIPVFGTILAYISKKNIYVDFLKDEFKPEIEQSSARMYFLAGAFGVMTIITLFIYLISSAIITSSTNEKYDEILRDQYKKYFREYPKTEKPIAEASKLLEAEKKGLKNIEVLISENESLMDLLKDILTPFPKDSDFNLRNIVINERVIRIDGTIGSSAAIDEYKEKLNENKNFDSVTMNIKSSRKDNVMFSMTIKMKVENTKKSPKK